jgi:hypothetical protein
MLTARELTDRLADIRQDLEVVIEDRNGRRFDAVVEVGTEDTSAPGEDGQPIVTRSLVVVLSPGANRPNAT